MEGYHCAPNKDPVHGCSLRATWNEAQQRCICGPAYSDTRGDGTTCEQTLCIDFGDYNPVCTADGIELSNTDVAECADVDYSVGIAPDYPCPRPLFP
jgi:hypothetical protein